VLTCLPARDWSVTSWHEVRRMLMSSELKCRSALTVAAAWLVVATAHGQSPGRQTFEAASIKPNRSMEARQELDLQAGGRPPRTTH